MFQPILRKTFFFTFFALFPLYLTTVLVYIRFQKLTFFFRKLPFWSKTTFFVNFYIDFTPLFDLNH